MAGGSPIRAIDKLMQELSTPPEGMGASDVARRNTDLLDRFAQTKPSDKTTGTEDDTYASRLADPKYDNLLRTNPSYVERTTPEYVNRQALDYVPHFRGLSEKEADATRDKLLADLKKKYPRGYDDQDEKTSEGKLYWDGLRAIIRAHLNYTGALSGG